VQNAANASSLNIGAAQGVTWKAIASTAAVTARDNTSTNIAVDGTGEAIFLLNGTTIVADDYVDLWSTGDKFFNKTEELTTPPQGGAPPLGTNYYSSVWAGTYRNAYPDANYGTQDTYSGGGPLGDPDGVAMGGLWSPQGGTQWIWRFGMPTDTQLPLFALSEPLTITDDAAGVPEPSTFLLAALGLLGLGWYGRRRRRQ
jgi:hypothetical protein